MLDLTTDDGTCAYPGSIREILFRSTLSLRVKTLAEYLNPTSAMYIQVCISLKYSRFSGIKHCCILILLFFLRVPTQETSSYQTKEGLLCQNSTAITI